MSPIEYLGPWGKPLNCENTKVHVCVNKTSYSNGNYKFLCLMCLGGVACK
jgi:hypothetical protein